MRPPGFRQAAASLRSFIIQDMLDHLAKNNHIELFEKITAFVQTTNVQDLKCCISRARCVLPVLRQLADYGSPSSDTTV